MNKKGPNQRLLDQNRTFVLYTSLLASNELFEFHFEHFFRRLRSQLSSQLTVGHHRVHFLARFVGQLGREPRGLVELVHRAPYSVVVMPHLVFALKYFEK